MHGVLFKMKSYMPIRVLHIVTYMGRGGLETMLMNYYRRIDHRKIQFDFLVHRDFEADYDAEIESMGGRIFRVPKLNPFSREYYRTLNAFFKEHPEYKIVHSHLDCMAGIPLKVAKENGIPVRIAHSHNSNQAFDKKYLLKLYFKRLIPYVSNKRFACGEEAGKWMFNGAYFTILNNAIDAEKYKYDQAIEREVRFELGIPSDAKVVGNVGRFAPQKNHSFIVECFYELYKKNHNAWLLLIGDGELRTDIENKINRLGISNRVIFTGVRDDVDRLLQTVDVFLFPSLHEGLPVSIIEAQAAGIPCIISDKVPIECKKTDRVFQYSLGDSAECWASYIMDALCVHKEDTVRQIVEHGFDIKTNADNLQRFYMKAYKKVCSTNNDVNAKKMTTQIPLTVFTPAFNRANTLPRTYESLKKQENKNIIWLIIDDGSSENTAELVKSWINEENDFEIQYIYKENGGMHTSHNVAYENIKTTLNICIDSDDCLAAGAVDEILQKWEKIKDQDYAGIIGLDADLKGQIIGKGFPTGLMETTLGDYYANGGSGDKKLVYRTDIIKMYPPYPVFDGEKYVALAYKYRLIDQEYKLAVLNKVLCNVEYQPDGSSGTMWKQYLKYPKGFAFWRKICMRYPTSYKRLFIDCIHYVSSSIIAKNPRFINESPRKVMTLSAIPFGIVLSLITKLKAK